MIAVSTLPFRLIFVNRFSEFRLRASDRYCVVEPEKNTVLQSQRCFCRQYKYRPSE